MSNKMIFNTDDILTKEMMNCFVQQVQVKSDLDNASDENIASQLAVKTRLDAVNIELAKKVNAASGQTISGNNTFSGANNFTNSNAFGGTTTLAKAAVTGTATFDNTLNANGQINCNSKIYMAPDTVLDANNKIVTAQALGNLSGLNENVQNGLNNKMQKIVTVSTEVLTNKKNTVKISNIMKYEYLLYDIEFYYTATTLMVSLISPFNFYSIAARTDDNGGVYCGRIKLEIIGNSNADKYATTFLQDIGYYSGPTWNARSSLPSGAYSVTQIRGILK